MSEDKYLSLLDERKPKYVVGFDEVGNGAIAGELCVASCVLPVSFDKPLKDSKCYTEKNRTVAYNTVLYSAMAKQDFMFSPLTIACIGHKKALNSLFFNALYYMYAIFKEEAIYVLDGVNTIPDVKFEHFALVKADSYVPSVSGASILAKVRRDLRMKDVGFEEWEFGKHKGYPTKEHLSMLRRSGPIKGLHRMNIGIVQKALDSKGWYKKSNG